jgi:hypothetical protein
VLTRVLAVACFVFGIPVGPGFSVRLFIAVALAFAWIAGYAVYLRRHVAASNKGYGRCHNDVAADRGVDAVPKSRPDPVAPARRGNQIEQPLGASRWR